MDNIEETYGINFMWEEPISYKEIMLYPICCKDVQIFYASVHSLLYDPLRHNSTISTLPRLYFLTDILNHQEDTEYLKNNMFLYQLFVQLQVVLKLVLREQEFGFIKSNNRFILRVKTNSGNIVDIKAKDFETMRGIILHQNSVDYDDTFIHEDIRKWIAEQESADKSPKPTLEDYMEAFMCQMGFFDVEEFKKVSLRRFNRVIEKILSRENYDIQMTASMSGFVTFEDKIDHWIAVNKKNSIYEKYFKKVK